MGQPASITAKDILTPEQAAKILGVCKDTIYATCDAGELPHVRLKNRRRIPAWLLMEWLHRSGEKLGLSGGYEKIKAASAATLTAE